MKTKQRHQLKENELAGMIAAAREQFEKHQRVMSGVLLVLLVVGAVAGGVVAWQGQTEARAEQLLGEAMVTFNARVVPVTAEPEAPGEVPAAAAIGATGTFPSTAAKLNAALPKLKAAADAYPDTDAGVTARYHYASSLAALGRHDEAVKAFDEVNARAGGDSLYGRMARLGKADALVRAGQNDAAIATWKELAASSDEVLPKDAILMELGRAYQAAGNTAEARKTFEQLIKDHPTSPYTAEARAELGS
ncbi:MAG: tetratricopeptide repeat protein [Acidobacteria bacterium]|nr:tetratricopeptide repeat protein [Acidobacteriota bacterium]